MLRDELEKIALQMCAEGERNNEDALKTDSRILVFLFDNCDIFLPDENRFFVGVDCCDIQAAVAEKRASKLRKEIKNSPLYAGEKALAYTGRWDFSHTSAHWESVLSLGIAGLKNRIEEHSRREGLTPEAKSFYENLLTVYDAALRFVRRAAEKALAACKKEMGESLVRLTSNAPSSLFEAAQTVLIYYVLQTIFEGTYLRTLGRLDSLLWPFYEKEDPQTAKKIVLDLIREADRLQAPSNMPFMIGGTDENKRSLVNPLSYILLDTYRNAGTTNTKLHLLISEGTPKDLILSALDCVREGKNSIVFMSDGKIVESLVKLGEKRGDAARYHVVGCYECGADQETTCSCNARVNLAKALECTLNGGKDMLTGIKIGLEPEKPISSFDGLTAEFLRQVKYFCDCAVKITDHYEKQLYLIHSAPILSGTYPVSLEKGADIYCARGARYNNSSLNAIGLATAVDSLSAIRKLVYEQKRLTLGELTEILKNDWRDNEPLRLFAKNRAPKFGTDDPETDALAKMIVDALAEAVDRRPNQKGGVYRLGLFSINWRWDFGEKTAASADGRKSGDTLSQNTSASFGAARDGASAHLKSVAALDASEVPNGAIADIDLHSSSIRGENGLEAFYSLLTGYLGLGGFAVHFNVLDSEALKKAKADPDAYPDLQVRLCGWNVLFNSLSEKEKDEFIARSEREG
ncbi:MAG: hypothetical protein IJV00_03965 [Clostridia bacterium]|nr:hypothetical protein [Clostridia bacterium]